MSAARGGDEHGRRRLLACAVALGLGGLAVAVGEHAYRRLPHPRPLEELSLFPSGAGLKPMALGHAETLADLAWIRAVQYYGEHRSTDNRFDRLGHLFDVLTTLSPRFRAAYVFGAFALAQEGFDFTHAERLILKGLDANPRDGQLAFEMGFLHYVRPGQRDLLAAARYFEQAARQPNAPAQALRFAAFARARSGDARVAWQLWNELAARTANRHLKALAEGEMARIEEAWRRGLAGPDLAPLPQTRVLLPRAGQPRGESTP